MSWVKKSEGSQVNPSYSVYTETLTTKSVGNGSSNWSSIIDFVPPGADFQIIANTAATNLSTSTHLELFVSHTLASAAVTTAGRALRYRRNETPFKPLTAELDTATKVINVDVSSKGQYPYYFLKVPKGGGSVTLKVIIGKPVIDAV